jgi:hypothetical protein
MLPRQTILGAVLLTANFLAAQPTLQLCIVEPSQGFTSGENSSLSGGGIDAKLLVKQLSGRKLAEGTTLQPIPIIRFHSKDAETDAHRQDCSLIIELWNHNIEDMAAAGIPTPVPYHGDPIDIGVEWAMRRNDTRKVLASGYAPPGLNRGGLEGHSVVKPYSIPVIANQIVDKLNHLPNRPTPQP